MLVYFSSIFKQSQWIQELEMPRSQSENQECISTKDITSQQSELPAATLKEKGSCLAKLCYHHAMSSCHHNNVNFTLQPPSWKFVKGQQHFYRHIFIPHIIITKNSIAMCAYLRIKLVCLGAGCSRLNSFSILWQKFETGKWRYQTMTLFTELNKMVNFTYFSRYLLW